MDFSIMFFMRNLDVILPPDVYLLSAFIRYLVFLSLRMCFQKVKFRTMEIQIHAICRKLKTLGISESSHEIQLYISAMRCVICYDLYNFKNVKNTHGGVLIFNSSGFLNCTNGTKSLNASQVISITLRFFLT